MHLSGPRGAGPHGPEPAPELAAELSGRLEALLADDDAERGRRYPGPSSGRQPVHTAYVPADRFSAGTPRQWGEAALRALDEHGPLPGFDEPEHRKVRAKLEREPVEDLRIDFEDGYGVRPDEVEDAAAVSAATALAELISAGPGEGPVPPFSGLRMKSLEPAVRRRGVSTLTLFLQTLLEQVRLPDGFRITLPKVTSVRQVQAMVECCEVLESRLGLAGGQLRFELQIETPQAILGPDGTQLVAPMITAAAGRCVGLHYGTYDYSASLGIAAAFQSMAHPAADHAKAVMQVAAAETGIAVSDGSTNVLPVGDTAAVRQAWQLHAGLVRRSLERGFYQGWDLHPAQLVSRYAATFRFFTDGLGEARARLAAYQARLQTGVADEPATARALADYLARGVACGAITDEPVIEPAIAPSPPSAGDG
jgi:citrate lyase beta subunit